MHEEDKEWLRQMLPSYPGDFQVVGGYKKSGESTCLNFTGFCPVHDKRHHSNHWYLVVTGEDRKIRCHKDHSNTAITSKQGGARVQAIAKATAFKWRNDSPLHRNLATRAVYQRTPEGWKVHAPDTDAAQAFDDSSTFVAEWPVVLRERPLTPLTATGHLLRWAGEQK